jgi:hypothetical protein
MSFGYITYENYSENSVTATDWRADADSQTRAEWEDAYLSEDAAFDADYHDAEWYQEQNRLYKLSARRFKPPKRYRFSGAGPFVYPKKEKR